MADRFLNRREQMFPQLTEAQLGRICRVGARRTVRAGEILYETGERHTTLLVLLLTISIH